VYSFQKDFATIMGLFPKKKKKVAPAANTENLPVSAKAHAKATKKAKAAPVAEVEAVEVPKRKRGRPPGTGKPKAETAAPVAKPTATKAPQNAIAQDSERKALTKAVKKGFALKLRAKDHATKLGTAIDRGESHKKIARHAANFIAHHNVAEAHDAQYELTPKLYEKYA
jgi:hypothetical protein